MFSDRSCAVVRPGTLAYAEEIGMRLDDTVRCEASVRITVNGRNLLASRGETLLAAAKRHGIEIPTLCSDPRIKPTGKCKLCVVEIAGQTGQALACETPVREGMSLATESPTLKAARSKGWYESGHHGLAARA